MGSVHVFELASAHHQAVAGAPQQVNQPVAPCRTVGPEAPWSFRPSKTSNTIPLPSEKKKKKTVPTRNKWLFQYGLLEILYSTEMVGTGETSISFWLGLGFQAGASPAELSVRGNFRRCSGSMVFLLRSHGSDRSQVKDRDMRFLALGSNGVGVCD